MNSARYRVLSAISRNVPVPLTVECTTALQELLREKQVRLQRDENGKPVRWVPTTDGHRALDGAV